MKIRRTQVIVVGALAVGAALAFYPKSSALTEMADFTEQDHRLKTEGTDSRLLCFGRYAVKVPKNSRITWGDVWFPSRIEVIEGGVPTWRAQINKDVVKILDDDKNAEIVKNRKGWLDNTWELRYYEHEYAKSRNYYIERIYVNLGDITYSFRGGPTEGEVEGDFNRRMAARIARIRRRAADQVPPESGFCVEHGFLESSTYREQEMVSAGIRIADFPHVTFSVSSNKNAYSAYSSAEFESRVRSELSLLARIKAAQDQQGTRYPKRTVLREGKRTVQHWHGEESLIRRADGTHDFEWAFVGTPGDVANPSEFSVQMYTKVAHNTVGAADKASLSDEEAIALWDRLLSGLKFRVKVPGAPGGSYYFLPGAATPNGAKP